MTINGIFQLLLYLVVMTRGALTTFSIANDVAKYFAIIPAAFATTYPVLNALNVMRLATPQSAIMSAVIFNALIIVALIPLSRRPAGRSISAQGTGVLPVPVAGDVVLLARRRCPRPRR
jgi:potassium-transporting ATPase ATP-binding subunit